MNSSVWDNRRNDDPWPDGTHTCRRLFGQYRKLRRNRLDRSAEIVPVPLLNSLIRRELQVWVAHHAIGTSFALRSPMRLRYKDQRGKVVVLQDVAWLAQAVRNGAVTPDTPLSVGDEEQFRSAGMVVAYQQVVVAIERNRLGSVQPVGDERPGQGAKRSRVRTAAFVLVGAATVALVYFRVRAPEQTPSAVSSTAAPAPAPAPEMQAALDHLVTEFGDSIALRQHQLEEWLAQQGLEQRVQGRALQTPSSLRALRAAAADYLGRVEALLSSGSVLASRLVQRADSMEGIDGVRRGLFAAVGDALRSWERDLAAYAEVQRSTAATLDSLAEFTLGRQQSFVVREGHPVFLSRTDAARFREILSELDDLASKEQRWAEAVLARNPNWMVALAPADRPAFRRAPLQRSNQ